MSLYIYIYIYIYTKNIYIYKERVLLTKNWVRVLSESESKNKVVQTESVIQDFRVK